MAKEYIDREEAVKTLYDADAITMNGVKILNQLPAADVAPVVHSHWIIGKDEDTFDVLCPNCGYSECFDVFGISTVKAIAAEMHYCPNCGAAMDLEVDDA